MIETIETGAANLIGVKLRGKLHGEDYQRFLPQIETILTDDGKFRMYVEFEDFHGWDLRAAWDDMKFSMRHYSDFERIAMVGDRRWERWMAALCRPFTKAHVRYFDRAATEEAWKWLLEKEVSEAERERTTDEIEEAWRGFPWYGF
jgi:hypothetical protein